MNNRLFVDIESNVMNRNYFKLYNQNGYEDDDKKNWNTKCHTNNLIIKKNFNFKLFNLFFEKS